MHEPFTVKVLQNRERLHRNARDHLLRHHLPVRVPLIPQRRPQQIHHHHVVVSLTPLIVHLRHPENTPQRVIHAPLVRWSVITSLTRPVFKLQRHLVRIRPRRRARVGRLQPPSDVHLPEPALSEFPFHDVHGRSPDLRLHRSQTTHSSISRRRRVAARRRAVANRVRVVRASRV